MIMHTVSASMWMGDQPVRPEWDDLSGDLCELQWRDSSTPFPTTVGVGRPLNASGTTGGCNEAAVKIAFNFAGVAAGLRVSVNGRQNDTSGCVPAEWRTCRIRSVMRNRISGILGMEAGYGNYQVMKCSIPIAVPGTYTIMLVAIDSNSCNVADTTYRYVIGADDKAPVDFSVCEGSQPEPCTALTYDFTNLSTAPPGKPFGPASFIWEFGDTTALLPGWPGPVTHSYQNARVRISST
jgi:hypothetical protein